MAQARAKKKAAPKKKTAPVKAKKPVAKKAPPKTKKKVVAARPNPKPKKPAPTTKSTAKKAKPAIDARVTKALKAAEVDGLVKRLPSPVQPVVNTLRAIVLEAAPEAKELLDGQSPAYAANGIFARIEPTEREVLIRFLRGGELPSAGELKDGSIALDSVDAFKESVLRKLVREAVMLNLSK